MNVSPIAKKRTASQVEPDQPQASKRRKINPPPVNYHQSNPNLVPPKKKIVNRFSLFEKEDSSSSSKRRKTNDSKPFHLEPGILTT